MKNPFYEMSVKIHEYFERKKTSRLPKAGLTGARAGIAARRRTTLTKHVFIWAMLIIPITSWLVFWLYANFKMILMAFQTPQGE